MTRTLGFRISRRLVAVAVLENDALVFRDCHYVSSLPSTRDAGLSRYFARLLDQWRPTLAALYAPTSIDGAAEHLARMLAMQAETMAIPVVRLPKARVFDAVAVHRVRTRARLGVQLYDLWPELPTEPLARQLPLAEAFVAALAADLEYSLSASP